MLEILTPASESALVQLATVKAHLRPAVTGTGQDARLNDLIRWASAAIDTWCRRTFARTEYRLTMAGSGSQWLNLSAGPVEVDDARLLPSFTYNGTAIDNYRVENPVAGILWRRDGWEQAAGWTGRFSRRTDYGTQDRAAFVTEFWAGYLMPGETAPEGVTAYTLPADVERAALLTVIDWYRADARDAAFTSTSTSESDADGTSRSMSASYAPADPSATLRPLPASALALLKDYRR